MGIIKKRPKIGLSVPGRILTGEPFDARIDLDVRRAVPVNAVTATLIGTETAAVGSGKTRTRTKKVLCRLRATASSSRVLRTGAVSFGCRFTVPAGLPPSWRGTDSTVSYALEVVVDILWWPDA